VPNPSEADLTRTLMAAMFARDAWAATDPPPDAPPRRPEQRALLLEGELAGMIAKLSALGPIVEKALAESTPAAIRARRLAADELKTTLIGPAQVGQNPGHIATIVDNAARRERAQQHSRFERDVAETAAKLRQVELEIAVARSSTGQVDLGPLVERLTFATNENRRAQAALAEFELGRAHS